MSAHQFALRPEPPYDVAVFSSLRTAGKDGYGMSEAAIAAWRAHAEHCIAQENGRTRCYEHYEIRVARVERAWGKPV